MADIEYSATESEPTFESSLPFLVWKIEGETAGKYWLGLVDGLLVAVWVPSGCRRARRTPGALSVSARSRSTRRCSTS